MSASLSAAELAALRATVDASLPQTVTVRRSTRVRNAQGGNAETWADAGTYAGALVEVTPNPTPGAPGARAAVTTAWKCLLPQGADVRTTDRLRIDGIDYEIIAPVNERALSLNTAVWVRRAQ